MYKKCIIWLFLSAVFTANFSGLFVYIGFELNKEYITSNLCVNRNKPWMNYNGKCYLWHILNFRFAIPLSQNGVIVMLIAPTSALGFNIGYTSPHFRERVTGKAPASIQMGQKESVM